MLQNTCLLLTLQGATATEISGPHGAVYEELLSSGMCDSWLLGMTAQKTVMFPVPALCYVSKT